ncbi:MAG: aminotransferase class IV [Planctomycetota bacterium]
MIPLVEVKISPWDFGFTMGVTVTEFLRTYGQQLRLLDHHLDRLMDGLSTVGIEGIKRDQVASTIQDVLLANLNLVRDQSELSIHVCITPGESPAAAPPGFANPNSPTVLVYARPLDTRRFQDWYQTGIPIQVVSIEEVSHKSISKSLKCRSRMHYYLAEKEARNIQADSRALLLDHLGHVAEGTTASILVFDGQTLIAPPDKQVLNSVSTNVTIKLAGELGIPTIRKNLSIDSVKQCQEAFWCSIPYCLFPVSSINGHKISEQRSLFQQLLQCWTRKYQFELQ